jgi:serine/threonine protein kinase
MLRVDPERWRALSPLLDRALDLAAERRAAFLAELGREHPDLATHLGELLKEHDRLSGSSFLESSSVLDGAPVPSLAGQTLGPYTLEAPVGAGGMGTVWRARRSDGRFEAHVAIKLLNLALLDSGGEARVRREATLLARLAHPNIARLLDAGITATGQPYLVLEYVEGVRIDRYADERRLDPF